MGSNRFIGRFELLGKLGEGGMGVVHLAHDAKLGRRVAVKSLPVAVARDPEMVEALELEARNLAALSHPNIGMIFELVHEDDALHLVLEFIEGETLAARLTRSPCSPDEAIRIGMQVASALGYAHQRGWIHRDLKPSNVMLSGDRVRLLDFGIAIATGLPGAGDRGHLGGKALVGTPAYMSPERIRGGGAAPAWDVWSLGCVLFEMICGHPAFHVTRIADLSRILDERPPLHMLPAGIPAGLEAVITGCLAKDPGRRVPSMQAVHEALAEILAATRLPAERWVTARYHALASEVSLDDTLPVRIGVRVPDGAPESVHATLDCGGTDWTLSDATTKTDWLVTPGASVGALIGLRPARVGSLELPVLRLGSPGHERNELLPASPRSLRVRARETDLQPLLGGIVSRVAPDDPRSFPAWGTWFLLRGVEGSGRGLASQALGRRMRSRGYRVIRAAASISGRVGRKLLQDLVRGALGIVDTEHTPSTLRTFAVDRLEEHLGRGAQEARYFLDLLFDGPARDLDPTREFRCWSHLLASIAREAPVALLIQHLPDADPETIALLVDILHQCHESSTPVLAIATTGSRDADSVDLLPLASHALRRTLVVPLDLPHLGEPETECILSLLYPGATYRDYYPMLVGQVLARSGGQLATTLALCEALGAERTTEPLFQRGADGAFHVVPNRDPGRLLDTQPRAGATAAQVRAALGVEHRAALELCSLLGAEFPVAPLTDLGLSAENVDEALDAMQLAGLVRPVDPELTTYRFTDARIPEAIRADLEASGSRSAGQQRRRVAARLLEHYANAPGAAEWLGSLLIDLGEPREGVRLLLGVLTQHVAFSRYESAHALFPAIQSVLNRIGTVDSRQALAWQVARARVLLARNDLAAAREAIAEARRLADEIADPVERARTLLLQARVDTEARDYVSAEAALRTVESLSAELRDDALTLDARINRAVVQRRLDRREEAKATLEANLRDFAEESHPLAHARTHINLGFVLHQLGNAPRAREHFRTAFQLARRLEQPELETQAHVWLCNLDFADGRFEDARRGYQVAVERFQSIQNRGALSRACFNLAQAEAMLGRTDRAVIHLKRAIDIAQGAGHRPDEQQFLVELTKRHLDCGRWADARRALDRARELTPERGVHFDHYQLDAYALHLDPSCPPLPVERVLSALGRWQGTQEAQVDSAGWFAIGALSAYDPRAAIDGSLLDACLDIDVRLARDTAQLPTRMRLIAELARFPGVRPRLGAAVARLGPLIDGGPAGAGRDLFAITTANLSSAGAERERGLDRAATELARWEQSIDDPKTRADLTSQRRTLHRHLLA
ncbi:MAG: protein kinase [Planctomycetota bacterium]